jgi:hypothetical protein
MRYEQLICLLAQSLAVPFRILMKGRLIYHAPIPAKDY